MLNSRPRLDETMIINHDIWTTRENSSGIKLRRISSEITHGLLVSSVGQWSQGGALSGPLCPFSSLFFLGHSENGGILSIHA